MIFPTLGIHYFFKKYIKFYANIELYIAFLFKYKFTYINKVKAVLLTLNTFV